VLLRVGLPGCVMLLRETELCCVAKGVVFCLVLLRVTGSGVL